MTVSDVAILVRSKNAGAFWYTFDIMFEDPAIFAKVRDAQLVTRDGMAKMFKQNPEDVLVVAHDKALAIKVSFPRRYSSGSPYDSDVFGGQQYAPLLDIEIPS